MTQIGAMDKRVTFQTGTLVSDGMGAGGTMSWADTLTCWVALWPLRGSEALEGMKLEHTITHKVRCWYSDLINPKQRIKYGTRCFEIISLINPDEANIELELLVTEIFD